jgi:hypothetical protein
MNSIEKVYEKYKNDEDYTKEQNIDLWDAVMEYIKNQKQVELLLNEFRYPSTRTRINAVLDYLEKIAKDEDNVYTFQAVDDAKHDLNILKTVFKR